MKWLVSVVVPTAPSFGAQKEGQARAALVLGRGIEQGLAAAAAAEDAGALLVVQRAGEGTLGAVVAQHMVLQRIELLLPLAVALLHLVVVVALGHASSDGVMVVACNRVRSSETATDSMARSSASAPPSSSPSSRSMRSRASLRGSLQCARAASGSVVPAARAAASAEASRSDCRRTSSSCTASAACAGHWPSRGSFCAALASRASDSRSPRRK